LAYSELEFGHRYLPPFSVFPAPGGLKKRREERNTRSYVAHLLDIIQRIVCSTFLFFGELRASCLLGRHFTA
jgi:hypothetical protein